MVVQAAMDAVKQYVYKPFLLNDNAVEVETTVEVPIRMEEAKGLPSSAVQPPVAYATQNENSTDQHPVDQIPPNQTKLVRVSKDIAASHLVQSPEPVYPPVAKIARVQGVVTLNVRIGKDGHVAAIKVISGHPMLLQAAMDAVRRYVYKPFLLDGHAVEFETIVQVPFQLGNK